MGKCSFSAPLPFACCSDISFVVCSDRRQQGQPRRSTAVSTSPSRQTCNRLAATAPRFDSPPTVVNIFLHRASTEPPTGLGYKGHLRPVYIGGTTAKSTRSRHLAFLRGLDTLPKSRWLPTLPSLPLLANVEGARQQRHPRRISTLTSRTAPGHEAG